MSDSGTRFAPVTQLWRLNIETTFEAADAAEADQMAAEITGSLLDHEAVWAATGEFDPEQPTETVDA